jgi:hypothetical protein
LLTKILKFQKLSFKFIRPFYRVLIFCSGGLDITDLISYINQSDLLKIFTSGKPEVTSHQKYNHFFSFDFVQKNHRPSQARKPSQITKSSQRPSQNQAKFKNQAKHKTKPSQSKPSHQLFFGFQAKPIQATKICWLAEVWPILLFTEY